jgi:hypothetical protein
MIKFNKYNVTNGSLKARIFYALDNRTDGRKVVTLYAKDWQSGRALGEMLTEAYENNTDMQSDYFEKGIVRLFEDHPLYAPARIRAEQDRSLA